MSWRGPTDDLGDAPRGPSSRAQRLLVRVLLALRREGSARCGSDERRVQILADRIMVELPRRLIPIGATACAGLALACLMPLLRDALPATGVVAAPTPAASIVESGLRAQGEAINQGLDALRAAVAPFAAEEPEQAPPVEAPKSAIAAAPFKKS